MDVLTLSDENVRGLLDPDALLDALAAGFVALSGGLVAAPARSGVTVLKAGHSPGFLLTMPAWQPQSSIAIKIVSVFHANDQVGLPSHQALICLFDEQTGAPLAVMNGVSVTALRTAGAAALSARLLARKEARVLAILGAGVQGRAHLKMFPYVREFHEIRIASRNHAHAQQLAATVPQSRAVQSFEEAVHGADIVCLCSSSASPIIAADWLSPGVHVTSVGYNVPGGELDRAVIARGTLFVETRMAFEPPPAGCGELTGLKPETGTELGEVLSGQRPGRQTDDEITVYKAMGHAMEDMVTANLVYQRALQHSRGHTIAL
ncbi:MAG: ornithine cyclodeaminase family protein [Ktedonobacteraceae bacterium]